MEQFRQKSLLEHEPPQERFGGHGAQQRQAVIQRGAGTAVAARDARRQRHQRIGRCAGSAGAAAAFHRLLALAGVVGDDVATAGRHPLRHFGQLVERRFAFRVVALRDLLDRPVNMSRSACASGRAGGASGSSSSSSSSSSGGGYSRRCRLSRCHDVTHGRVAQFAH